MDSTKLECFRLKNDLTLEAIAEATGLAIATVQRAENGKPTNKRTAYKLQQFMETYASPEKMEVVR